MLKVYRSAMWSCVSTAAVVVSGQAHAQNSEQAATAVESVPAPATQPGAGEIVVTAQRRTERLNDVPVTITAVGGAELTARGINSASGLSNVVPGFSATDSGSNTPVYTLRGIGFNETSLAANPTVAVYLDEVPLPYAGMTRGAAFDLARVEVLKGPQGTLYGSNSTGGAINFIANRPTTDMHFGGSLSYGRFGTFEGTGYLSGAITDTLSVRASLNTIQSGDWQYSTSRNDTLGSQDRVNARVLADWKPTDGFRVMLNLSGWRDKSDSQALQLQQIVLANSANAGRVPPALLTLRPPARDARAADWDPNTDLARDDRLGHASMKAELDLADSITLTSITAYTDYASRVLTDRDGTQFANSANLFDGTIKSFYQELRLASQDPQGLSWIVGANYRSDKISDSYGNILGDASSSFAAGVKFDRGNIEADTDVKAYGLFANVDYALSSKLTLSGGLRYSKDDRDLVSCTYDPGNGKLAAAFTNIINGRRAAAGLAPIGLIAPGSCVTIGRDLTPTVFRGNLTEDNISWRAAVAWRPVRDTLVYASVNRGYKSGSFPTISATSVAQFVPVTQESVLAYEVGFKSSFIPRVLQVNASAFYYNYQNKQVRGRTRDPVIGLIQILTNVPKSNVKGAEAEIVLSPVRGVNLVLSASYLDAKVKEYVGFNLNATNVIDFKGQRLPYTSKWSVNFNPSFEFPLTDELNGIVEANAAYRSASSAFFGNEPTDLIPDYTTLDLRVGLRSTDRRWTATVWGRNVTNKYYYTNVVRGNDTYARVMAMPATYGVSVAADF